MAAGKEKTPEQKAKWNEYMKDVMVMEMDPQEKQIVKNKLQAIQNKIA